MKKTFTLLAFVLFSVAILNAQQVQRTILIEEFTNASCAPCAAQNPDFNTLLHTNDDIVIPIKYQVWWPGFDPMYEQTSEYVDVRVPYYDFSGVPTAIMNGVIPDTSNTPSGNWTSYPGGPYGYNQQVLDNESQRMSPFEVNVQHNIFSDLDSINIKAVIRNVDTAAFSASSNSLAAHVVITEDLIDFPSPPGSTDQEDFPEVMRKMLPDENGTSLPQDWAPGDSMVLEMTVGLPDYIYNYSEVSVVAFVQNTDSKEVWQAGKSNADPSIADNFADGDLQDNTVQPSNYCTETIQPSLILENAGNVNITSAEVTATLENGNTLTQNWSGDLANGESAQIDFTEGNLVLGENNISFALSSINGGKDVNRMNNDYDIGGYVVRIPASSVDTTPRLVGFDFASLGGIPMNSYQYNPDDARMYVVDRGVSNDVNWELGGFGNSSSCLRFDFYAMAPGVSSSLIFEKIDLSDLTNAYVKFSYAYRQYSNENDNFKIEASTDCGDTWVSVFDKSGANLSTGSAVNSGRFYPQPNEWVGDSIGIANLEGESEVVFRLTGTSDFGNSLYFDDFEIGGDKSSVGIQAIETNVSLFPNPTDEFLTIDLGSNAGMWDATIYNALGQQVDNRSLNLNERTTINVSELPSGYYMLKLNNGDKAAQSKFVIER